MSPKPLSSLMSILGFSGGRDLAVWVAGQVLGDDRIDLMVVGSEDLAH